MKIVIPMSGIGKRFADAGYTDIKPLIKVHGVPIVEWVTRLFPGETDFIFICRNEHLNTLPLESELKRIAPRSQVLGIEGHKLGPVYAVQQAYPYIGDNEQVIVNYCDFFQGWDYQYFKKTVTEKGCEGAIPCYTGFHPHLLPEENLYASCLRDSDEMLLEIKEKFSFEADKTKSFHSGGTYYFKSGEILKKYFDKTIEKDLSLNGEYYVSLVYNLLVKDGLKTWVYDKVPFFCQWGTPFDLEQYNTWYEIMDHYKK